MINAVDFTFDGMASEKFDLRIVNFDSGKVSKSTGISYSIEEESVRGKSTPYFFGVGNPDKITFQLTFARENELDRYDKNAITQWLFQKTYKPLRFIQNDLMGINFNCIMTNPNQVILNGYAYAISVDVICDSAFGFTEEMSYFQTLIYGANALMVHNPSLVNEYVYPKLVISIAGGNQKSKITIKNPLDSNTRILTLDQIDTDQNLTIDNNFGIIKTTGNASLMNITSKQWLRLLPGSNLLQINLTNAVSGSTLDNSVTVQLIAKYPIII